MVTRRLASGGLTRTVPLAILRGKGEKEAYVYVHADVLEYTPMFSTKSASRWPSGESRRLWKITRTAASRAGVTNLDNRAPCVDYATVNTPPSAGHHPLTNRVCDRRRVISVVDPAGKYCGALRVD